MTFTKLGKKIMAIVAVVLLGLGLVGCIDETPVLTLEEAQNNVETVAGRVIFDKSVTSNVTSNLDLASSYAALPDVVYEWSSSEEDLVEIVKNEDGTIYASVKRPELTDERIAEGEDYVLVKLTLKLSQTATNGQVASVEKVFELKVKAVKKDVYGTIAEVKNAAIQQYVLNNYAVSSSTKDFALYCATYGRVVSFVGNKSMFIADGEDGILVYGDFTSNCKVGDLVKVEGQVYGYYGQIEFGNEVNVTPVAADEKVLDEYDNEWRSQESFVLPAFQANTIEAYTNGLKNSVNAGNRIEDAEAFIPFSGAFFNLQGYLVKEKLATGDSYALVDPFNGEKVAIYHYCTDSEEAKAALNPLVGKYVKLNAITVDRYSSNFMYRILWTGDGLEEVATPEITDAQKVAFVAKQLEYAYEGFDKAYYNNQKFELPTVDFAAYADVEVEWTLTPENILVDGKLVVSADTTLELTATVSLGSESAEAKGSILVLQQETLSTVADVYAGEAGEQFIVQGVVQSVFSSYRNFYLADETGTILVYSSLPEDMKPGDTVKVTGVKDVYNGCGQFKKDGISITLVSEGTWSPASATPATVSEILAYTQENAPYGQYLEIKGALVKGSDGYYYIADAADNSKQVSLYYSTVDAIAAFENTGEEIIIKAHFYGFSSSGAARVVFSGREGEYVLGELTDEQKVDAVAARLSVNASTSGDYTLQSELDGCSIAWSLIEGAGVAALDENVLTITQGDADAEITLKAVITLGSITKEVEISCTVAANGPATIASAHNLADGEEVVLRGVVTGVYQPWNDQYGNISVYIEDATGSILCYRLGTYVEVGQEIIVTGEVTSYNGTKQIAQGCTAEIVGGKVSLAVAKTLADGASVVVKGTVSEINGEWNESYGNMNVTITDANGDTLYLFRLATKVEMGDVITVTGKVGSYEGAKQIAAGATAEIEPKTDDVLAATISFADSANRTVFNSNQQVWVQNGITVTNNQAGSTSAVADYTNPARFYKSSELIIAYTKAISKLVITCSGDSKYHIPASLVIEGATISIESGVCTIVFDTPVSSLTIASLPNQFRISSIEVYTK